jgi:HEAT repeat protein
LLTSNTRDASGAAWGLALLNDDSLENFAWRPTETNLDQIISVVGDRESDAEAVRFLIRILGRERDRRAAGVLIARLEDQSELVLKAAVEAIGQIGEPQAVEKLTVILQCENKEIRQEAAKALAMIGNSQAIDLLINTLSAPDRDTRIEALEALSLLCKDGIDRKLLSEEFDAVQPFWDPLIEIDAERIDKATKVLKLPTEEVRARYEAIARLFPLKLEWQAIENV